MPRHRRSSLLATLSVAALLATGCSSAGPTLAPLTAAPVTPSPAPTTAPTLAPTPTVLATPQPPATCPAAGAPDAGIDLQTPGGLETIELQSGAMPTPAPVDASVVPIVATVLGGVDLAAELNVDSSLDDSIVISTVEADFLPFGTTTTLPVSATVEGSTVALRLPDTDVKGVLRLALSWSTRCGSDDGTGAIGLTVVNSSVAAGCPTTAEGLEATVLALANGEITVGTLDVPLGIVGWSGRWIPAVAATDFPEFAAWNRTVFVTAAPGTSIVISEAIDGLDLQTMRALTFLRSDVLAYLQPDSTGDLPSVQLVTRSPGPKGRVGIPAQPDPGSYVIELQGSWLTSCLRLETYAVVSVEVR